MSGKGGYKHRHVINKRNASGRAKKARENIRRVRHQFESKGQTWDPLSDAAQLAALNHAARRHIARSAANQH